MATKPRRRPALPPASRYALVLVTAPSLPAARRLARAALRQRLAACVNLIPGLQSLYWWEGRVESARETLLLFKTRQSRLLALETLVRQLHPYRTPEFLTLTPRSGSQAYLAWLGANCP